MAETTFPKRKLAIFGVPGSGKSVVGNLLLHNQVYWDQGKDAQGQLYPKNESKSLFSKYIKPHTNPSREGANSLPVRIPSDKCTVTKNQKIITSNSIRWEIHETPGVLNGDSSSICDINAYGNINECITRLDGHFDFMCVVKDSRQEVTTADFLIWNLIKSIFENDIKIVIVFNFTNNDTDYQQEFVSLYKEYFTDILPVSFDYKPNISEQESANYLITKLDQETYSRKKMNIQQKERSIMMIIDDIDRLNKNFTSTDTKFIDFTQHISTRWKEKLITHYKIEISAHQK